jgi:hypothetical protein
MDQIAQVVKESALAAQQSAKACQDLSELALAQQNMVGNFKLPTDKNTFGNSRRGFEEQQSLPQAPAQKAFAATAH